MLQGKASPPILSILLITILPTCAAMHGTQKGGASQHTLTKERFLTALEWSKKKYNRNFLFENNYEILARVSEEIKERVLYTADLSVATIYSSLIIAEQQGDFNDIISCKKSDFATEFDKLKNYHKDNIIILHHAITVQKEFNEDKKKADWEVPIINKINNKNCELTLAVLTLTKDKKGLVDKNSALTSKIETLKNTFINVYIDKDNLGKQNKQLKSQLDSTTKEKNKEIADHTEKSKKCSELQQEIKDVKEKLINAYGEASELRKLNSQLESQLDSTTKELTEKIKDVTLENSQLKDQHASKKHTSSQQNTEKNTRLINITFSILAIYATIITIAYAKKKSMPIKKDTSKIT